MSPLRAVALSALASACALACLDDDAVSAREIPDAGLDDDAPPDGGFATGVEMIAAFGRCMSYADWIGTDLDELPRQSTDEGDACSVCHAGQATGAFLSEDPLATWQHHREPPTIYKIALPILDPESLRPVEVIPNDRYVAKGVGEDGHPTYVLDAAVVEALDRFFELTWSRFAEREGNCAPEDPASE